MSEENLQSAENAAPEATAPASTGSGEEMMPRSEAENLLKALKAEREARKQYERDLKETKGQLEKFAEINPEEYRSLQEEAAEAARLQAQWGEVRDAMETKYSGQAQEALKVRHNSKGVRNLNLRGWSRTENWSLREIFSG